MMKKGKVIFLSGIDTDIGKTIATGLLARGLRETGCDVITQKLVQTGCVEISEDILKHREIMGLQPLDIDLSGQTCPYLFRDPCSPHLAAERVGDEIRIEELRRSIESLQKQYDLILLEGAGGLFVPLQRMYTVLDFLQEQGYPLILVTSARLGSINHTLSSFELAAKRGLNIQGVIYNLHGTQDPAITSDSRKIFMSYLMQLGFQSKVVDLYPLHEYLTGGRSNDLATGLGLC